MTAADIDRLNDILDELDELSRFLQRCVEIFKPSPHISQKIWKMLNDREEQLTLEFVGTTPRPSKSDIRRARDLKCEHDDLLQFYTLCNETEKDHLILNCVGNEFTPGSVLETAILSCIEKQIKELEGMMEAI